MNTTEMVQIALDLAQLQELPLDSSVSVPGENITRVLAGKPAENMGQHTLKMCLTPEFLASDAYLSPELDKARMQSRQATCSHADYQRTGDSASWTLACTLGDGSTFKARLNNSASAERLSIHMDQDIQRPGGSQGRVVIAGEARYIGECTEGMSTPAPPAAAQR